MSRSNRSRKISKKSTKIKNSRALSRKLRLVKIVKSPIKTKKYRATFSDGTHTDFGAAGYQNYGGVGKSRHTDKERKKRYIQRHKDHENWKNPKSAGALSRWVLWNKDSFRASVDDYKRRFRL